MAEMEMTGGKSEEGRDEVETTCDDKSLDLITRAHHNTTLYNHNHNTTQDYTTRQSTESSTGQRMKARGLAKYRSLVL